MYVIFIFESSSMYLNQDSEWYWLNKFVVMKSCDKIYDKNEIDAASVYTDGQQ